MNTWQALLAEAEANFKKREEELTKREEEVDQATKANNATKASLLTQQQSLDQKALDATTRETQTVDALNDALAKKKKASELLKGVQDKIEFNAYKEDELNAREKLLDGREKKLDERKRWIVDRENLQRSH